MTDATNDWNDIRPENGLGGGASGDTIKPNTSKPLAAETKTFDDPTAAATAHAPTPAELAADADALLRKSLETIRAQAEDLKQQSTEWAALRTDQARELIDERPLTVVAAVFGIGLILGALISR